MKSEYNACVRFTIKKNHIVIWYRMSPYQTTCDCTRYRWASVENWDASASEPR